MPRFEDHERVPEPIAAASLSSFEYDDIAKGDQIGAGGEANVYRATVTEDGVDYTIAIKEPRFDGTVQTDIFHQFEDEAETWANLDEHQNIVTVHGYGTGSLPWIALEYMDGGTLGDHLDTIDFEESLWLAGRIAEGIRYGHRHGVAHLDLKPNNILLRDTPDGVWNYPKVSDWGLAKLLLDHSKSVDGLSPTYAAPEQFNTEEYGKTDDITDIYQFGAIVYELVTGQPPFTGSATDVMQSVLNDHPQPPSEINPDLPQSIDQIIIKSLSKQKEDRYDSILLFQRQLNNLFVEQTDLDKSELNVDEATPSSDLSTSRTQTAGQSEQSGSTATETDSSSGVSRRSALAVMGIGAAGLGGLYVMQSSQDDSTVNPDPANPDGSTVSSEDILTELWSGGDGFRIFAGDELFYTDVYDLEGRTESWALGGYDPQTGQEEFLSDAFAKDKYGAVYGPSAFAQDNDFMYVGGSWNIRTQGTADPNNAKLYSVDQDTGSLHFEFETPAGTENNEIRHVMSNGDDRVVFSVGAYSAGPVWGEISETESEPLVFGINRETGTESWRSTHSGRRAHFGGVSIYENKVFAAMDTIDVFDISDGNLINQIDYSSEYGVVISDDVLYTTGDLVRAYDLREETLQWDATVPAGATTHSLDVNDSRIFGATESALFALDRNTGERLWSTAVSGDIHRYRNPIDPVGILVFASAKNGDVYAVDTESGEIKFTLSSETGSFRAISTIEDILFVGGEAARAYQINDEWTGG